MSAAKSLSACHDHELMYGWMHRASRGLGLELVRQLTASASNLVIATARNPSTAPQLRALQEEVLPRNNLHVIQLDANDEESMRASVAQVQQILGDRGLDVLYNNAGVVSTPHLPSSKQWGSHTDV